jgi:flagellar basal body L-ring protein FlgH
MKTKSLRQLGLVALLLATGCAQLMGQLRRDLDDGYANEERTTRGGLLSDYQDMEGPITGGRGLASGGSSKSGPSAGQIDDQRWVSRMGGTTNLRDRARSAGGVSTEQDDRDDNADGADVVPQPTQPHRVTRGDFVDSSEDAGSLWATSGQTNFFFSKNRTRSSGDLVTITIEADLLRDLAAEVKRSLRPEEKEQEIALLEKKNLATKGAKAQAGATADGKTDEVKTSAAATDKEGQVSFSQVDLQDAIGVKAGDTFLAEVVERFPNGNYKIRGTKRLAYRGTTRLMTLIGVVRGSDLTDDDKVTSGKLYEYRLEAVR